MAMNGMRCCDFYQVRGNVVRTVSDKMPDEDKLHDLAKIFKVLGGSTRVKILYVLLEAEVRVCDTVQLLSMNQPIISHRLRILKQNRLVKSRGDGRAVLYSLAGSHVRTIINQSTEHVEEQVLLWTPMMRGWNMKYK